MKLYIIGSLSNPRVNEVANQLRAAGIDAFDQWIAAGPEADQHWKDYGQQRGWSYFETLKSDFVQTAFNFDLTHMQSSDGCVLVMPAGKSAHCELGWFVGAGKKAYILFDELPERPDLMPANLATGVFTDIKELIEVLTPTPDESCPHIYGGTCPMCESYRLATNAYWHEKDWK